MKIRLPVWVDGQRRGVEVVPAVPREAGQYVLEFTPGVAEGLAAGDTIELCDGFPGFRMIARGGQFGVWLWSEGRVSGEHAAVSDAQELARRLGGRVDGGTSRSIVLSIPASRGFDHIVRSIDEWTRVHSEFAWEFTNAYAADGVTLLDWWSSGPGA